jgi:hypothetical protein
MEGSVISFSRDNELLFEADIDERNQAFVREVTSPSVGSAFAASVTFPLDHDLLHRRLGHHSDTQKILSKGLVTGAKITSTQKQNPICEPCLAGKLNVAPFPSTGHCSAVPLELIHSDLKEFKVFTRKGWTYRVLFIDDHTGFKCAMHVKRKSDTFNAFKVFKAYAENHFGCKIKALQEDKGGEYMSTAFDNYLRSEGIVRRHLTRNRPQQNGMAERGNCTVDENTTAMLHEANLPLSFKALADAAYINMHPTSHIPENNTPYELWYKQKPDVSHLRVWGCLAYVHVQKDKRDTSGIHFQKCIFVGYPTEYKGWLFYNPVTRKVVTSERAVFDERYFPGNKPSLLQRIPQNPPSTFIDLPPHAKPQVVRDDRGDDEDDYGVHRAPPAPTPNPSLPNHSPPSTCPNSPPSPERSPEPEPALPPSPIGVAACRKHHGQTTEHKPAGEWWKAQPAY